MCSYFKKRMNKTIMQVLCDIRIMNACVLLNRFPDKTIAEISKNVVLKVLAILEACFVNIKG